MTKEGCFGLTEFALGAVVLLRLVQAERNLLYAPTRSFAWS